MSRIGKSIEIESRLVVVRGWWGVGEIENSDNYVIGIDFLFRGNKMFWN